MNVSGQTAIHRHLVQAIPSFFVVLRWASACEDLARADRFYPSVVIRLEEEGGRQRQSSSEKLRTDHSARRNGDQQLPALCV